MSLKTITGVVISNKMNKTIVVKTENRYSHKLYSKILKRTKRYLAHDELEECIIGDNVIIEESRPISKRKSWKLIKILSK